MPVTFLESHIPAAEAALIMPAMLTVQLCFCIRWSLNPEWDAQKMSLMRGNLQIIDRSPIDKLFGRCMAEVRSNENAMETAASFIPDHLQEYLFLACARITCLKGFEEDISRLSHLRKLFQINDDKSELLISLAKSEMLIIRTGRGPYA